VNFIRHHHQSSRRSLWRTLPPANDPTTRRIHSSIISTVLVGKGIGGHYKWKSCVVGSDKCVYGIPWNACRVVNFDPVNKSLTEIEPHLVNGSRKWGDPLLHFFATHCSIVGTMTLLSFSAPIFSSCLAFLRG
jgi:hypothetical protein